MGYFFAREDMSTVFHPLRKSEWQATNLYWNSDYSSSWFFALSTRLKNSVEFPKINQINLDPQKPFKTGIFQKFLPESIFGITSEWSLSDYKRRVSSTATIEAYCNPRRTILFVMESERYPLSCRWRENVGCSQSQTAYLDFLIKVLAWGAVRCKKTNYIFFHQ